MLGLDRDGLALKQARRRTLEQGCSSWVSFEETALVDFSTSDRWDAVVGRYILLFQPDPAAILRKLISYLKPGGLVVFHEADLTVPHPSFPPCHIWDQTRELIPETLLRAGIVPDWGPRLGKTYLDAGLPFPTIVADTPVGGGRGSLLYEWAASTVVALAPRLAEFGLSLPPGLIADDTLAVTLEDAIVAQGSQIISGTQFGAWSRNSL